MNKETVSRRNFVSTAAVAGLATLLYPTGTLLADEKSDPVFLKADLGRFAPSVPVSGDSAVDDMNQRAIGKWLEAVQETLDEGGEICLNTSIDPSPVTQLEVDGIAKSNILEPGALIDSDAAIPRASGYVSPVGYKTVNSGLNSVKLALNPTYTISNKLITTVNKLNSYAANGGGAVKHITSSWAKN